MSTKPQQTIISPNGLSNFTLNFWPIVNSYWFLWFHRWQITRIFCFSNSVSQFFILQFKSFIPYSSVSMQICNMLLKIFVQIVFLKYLSLDISHFLVIVSWYTVWWNHLNFCSPLRITRICHCIYWVNCSYSQYWEGALNILKHHSASETFITHNKMLFIIPYLSALS